MAQAARQIDASAQEVDVVTARNMADIERLADAFRDRIGVPADDLRPLDVSTLVDYALPKIGIHFMPVKDSDLPDVYAFAEQYGEEDDDIEVLLRQSEWDALHAGGSRAHHARGTVVHEIGHCILHIPEMRRRHALGYGIPRRVPAHRVDRRQNCEWQAYAFGGCILAPRHAILRSKKTSPKKLAKIFDTSFHLMTMHLHRLDLL
jgi:Zn-dependent peptidase ImmA (M78 family)